MKDIIEKIETEQMVDIYDGSINELHEFIKEANQGLSYGRFGTYWTSDDELLYEKACRIIDQVGHVSPGEVVVLDRSKVIFDKSRCRWVIPVEVRA